MNSSLDLSDSFNTSGEWTAGFTYDVAGNVLTATDAKGVTITNTYDQAGRVKTRSYSDSTPSVDFYYDGKGLSAPQNPNYAKGKLTKVTSSVSETRYELFDDMGRLTQMSQFTDGQTYTSKYTYNLSGALIEEEYPSGRKVHNKFESDGDLLKVSSQRAGGSFFAPYASNFSYTASGGISRMKLGNGRWETAEFNSRNQLTELGLGAGPEDPSLWKTNYEYGEFDANGDIDTTKNTGNIARQTLTVPGTTFVQSYKYDSLYRLTEAIEKTGGTTNWSQNWSYDRYGNRIGFAQNIAGLTDAPNPTIDENTNRFNSGQGFTYDKNGNVVADIDPNTSLSRSFTFNGDNKQTEVKKDGVTIGRYYYDGEGRRIKKVTDTETTIFVYSAGKLVAEYSTQLSQTPSINYTTTDHLGSPRIITDAVGAVKSRRDFMPFGEDIFINVGNRTSSLNYSSSTDDIKQKFTGYQKDNETGLDFAEARMYENRFGRFTAVDPLLASGKNTNPQTFNRYAYAGNNPIIRIDPTGKDWIIQITQTKVKEREIINGRVRIVERTINVQKPIWVSPDDAIGIPRVTGVWEITYKGSGFQALHPIENIASEVFATREEAKAKYNEWLLNDSVTFIDSGQGLPSELPENQEAIRSRLSFMLNSTDCSKIMTDIGRPTLSQTLTNRGLTIADPQILNNPESVGMIGGGFTEEARQQGLTRLNMWGSQAFTLVPEPYESQPRGRIFSFFQPSSFRRTWFGFGRSRLDENVVHEDGMHGAGIRPLFKLPWQNDLDNFQKNQITYSDIINACSIR